MPAYNAFLFDLNGTMVNDTHCHILAWQQVIQQLGYAIGLEEMKKQWYGKNEEMIERIFPNTYSDAEKTAIGLAKETAYQTSFKGELQPIAGLTGFIALVHSKKIALAVGSAASKNNLQFVVETIGVAPYFSAFISAEDVTKSKPHPETYLACANALNKTPNECLVFEDGPKGVEAAYNAGMAAIAIKTTHQEKDFAHLPNVLFFINAYADEKLLTLL